MPWHIVEDHSECPASRPFAVVRDSNGSVEGCHPSRADANDQLSALYAAEADYELEELALEVAMTTTMGGKPNPGTKPDKRLKENPGGSKGRKKLAIAEMAPALAAETDAAVQIADDTSGPFRTWEGVLAVEGVETGDGREFAPDSLEWPEPPLPLSWQIESQPQHLQSVVVGRIDEITRDGSEIRGSGVIDLGSEWGAEFARQADNNMAGGVSVDVDSVKDSDVELVFPEEDDSEDDLFMLFGPPPDKVVFHRGRIRGATLVALPAFVEAKITLQPIEEPIVSAGVLLLRRAVTAGAAQNEAPPRAWFQDPQLVDPTAWTIRDRQVFGHLALWDSCHTTFQDRCVRPPKEEEYPYFHLGELITAEGDSVAVGHITFGTGHASTMIDAAPAVAHYDDTGLVAADIAVGTDRHGIWVAGALRDDIDGGKLRELRAATLSGDWRRIGRQLRLVAVLAVNAPGFPVPRMRARFAGENTLALTAAGVVTEHRLEVLEHMQDKPLETIRIRKR